MTDSKYQQAPAGEIWGDATLESLRFNIDGDATSDKRRDDEKLESARIESANSFRDRVLGILSADEKPVRERFHPGYTFFEGKYLDVSGLPWGDGEGSVEAERIYDKSSNGKNVHPVDLVTYSLHAGSGDNERYVYLELIPRMQDGNSTDTGFISSYKISGKGFDDEVVSRDESASKAIFSPAQIAAVEEMLSTFEQAVSDRKTRAMGGSGLEAAGVEK